MTAEPLPTCRPTGPLAADDDNHRGDRLARFGTGIRRYLRFLGAAAEVADDLAQETLLRALRPEFDGAAPGVFRWLRTTARNLFWRHLAARFGRAAPRGAIAKELGLGDEGAKTLLRRVKARLRACIERRLREEDA